MEMTRRCSDVPWPVRVSIVALTLGLTVGMTGCLDGAASVRPAGDRVSLVGTPGAASTGRADLVATIDAMRARLRARPRDPEAAVGLAGALLRQARVVADAALAVEAEGALRDALDVEPAHYPARRMLGAVLLSQHRFYAAREVAEDAMGVNARDAWNHAVIGDASLEVGDYAQAFDAYDRMMTLRPSADAYARVAHAHEIQGELDRALATMTMAAEATSAHDPEGQAWARVQVGHLMFQLGRLDEAEREYRHAMHIFPEHPYARAGLARLAVARGEYHRALAAYESLMRDVPTPEWAAWIGDLHAALGDARAAEAAYEHAEQLEREGWANEEPQYAALARFLAQRNRRVSPNGAPALGVTWRRSTLSRGRTIAPDDSPTRACQPRPRSRAGHGTAPSCIMRPPSDTPWVTRPPRARWSRAPSAVTGRSIWRMRRRPWPSSHVSTAGRDGAARYADLMSS